MGFKLTCDSDTIDVLRDNSLPLDDFVELGSSTVENDGVESNTVQEAEADGQFLQLVEDGTSNFDDGELCGFGGIGRRGEDAQVAFDLTLGSNRVQESSNRLLQSFRSRVLATYELKICTGGQGNGGRNSICLGYRLNASDLETSGGDETRLPRPPDDESLPEKFGRGSCSGQHGCFGQGRVTPDGRKFPCFPTTAHV